MQEKLASFFLDPNDFPILSDSAGFENKNHLCDIEYSQERKPDVFADARVLVPGVNNIIKVVRANVHPKWPAFAVRIALENQCYVVLEPWGTAGDWGVCVCCSSYKKKTVWVDRDDHFTNKGHAKAVWHFPVTEVPSRHRGNPFDIHFSASRGQDERINASSGDFLARHQSVNLIGSSGRSPDIVVFYPSACQACDVMDGAFIIDSYYYFKCKKSGKKVMYLVELLDILFFKTGLRFMAVCSGGAALRKPSDPKAATFDELLQRVPSGLLCVIAIICGNDFCCEWLAVWCTTV